jgi:radical SAM superfamily enzyme YgiQ (UPF0313 family)
MKIVLVVPPALSLTSSSPLGLGYLASVLEKDKHEVKIFDFTKKHYRVENAAKIILAENPEIVGVSITTKKFLSAKKLIDFLKNKNKNITIVVGGIHITALPEYSFQELKADYGIVGEGEYSFCKLVREIQNRNGNFENIKGLIYRKNGKININPDEIIENLDELPYPAWHLIDPREYPPNPWQLFYKKFPVAPILTTRGCPNTWYVLCYCSEKIQKALSKIYS